MPARTKSYLAPAVISADRDALVGLKTLDDYAPSNPEFSTAAVAASEAALREAEEAELRLMKALAAARCPRCRRCRAAFAYAGGQGGRHQPVWAKLGCGAGAGAEEEGRLSPGISARAAHVGGRGIPSFPEACRRGLAE